MIVDVSATVWNWDTYAIVAGKPSPVSVGSRTRPSCGRACRWRAADRAEGMLVEQPGREGLDAEGRPAVGGRGARGRRRRSSSRRPWTRTTTGSNTGSRRSWLKRHLHEWRAELVWSSMRSMLRFYDLDRIVCWDASWGVWEAVRDGDAPATTASRGCDSRRARRSPRPSTTTKRGR